MAETVVLTVGLAAYSLEVVTMYNSLESLTLRSTDYVNERGLLERNVTHTDDVTELELTTEVVFELDEFAHWRNSCLFEVALKSLAGMLF